MKIAIDIDEVLANFVTEFLKYHNETYRTNLKFEDIHSYDLWHVFGGTEEETWKKFDEFYETLDFDKIKPINGSSEAIDFLTREHDAIIITSRPIEYKPKTLEWLNKYFPERFRTIRFTDEYNGENNGISRKSYICLEERTDVLLEDSAKVARDCSQICERIFLFNKPWNKNQYTQGNIIRVNSWQEVLEKIK